MAGAAQQSTTTPDMQIPGNQMRDAPPGDHAHKNLRQIGLALALVAGFGAIYLGMRGAPASVLTNHQFFAFIPGLLALIGVGIALASAPLGALAVFLAALAIPFIFGTSPAAGTLFAAALVGAGLIFNGYYLALSRAIDAMMTFIGRWVSWLVVAAVLVSAINAIIRKAFDTSSNTFLELQWVMFSAVFLMCSPWTLIANEHVRIDILNQRFPLWLRHTIEMIGHCLFLMPFALLMIYYGGPFFYASFSINEQSFSSGGLPQWPAKFLVLLGFTLMAIQGVSEIIKRICIITGRIPDPHLGASTHQPPIIEIEGMQPASADTGSNGGHNKGGHHA